jgi:hypothetical protein
MRPFAMSSVTLLASLSAFQTVAHDPYFNP